MDELILRSLAGRAGELDSDRLARWRRAATANEEYYTEVAEVWRLTELARPMVVSIPPTAEELISLASSPKGRHRWSHLLSNRRSFALVAASIATILLTATLLVSTFFFQPHTNQLNVSKFVTGESEMATVVLDDGSVVRLAPKSRLQFHYSRKAREVSLSGRAFFAVTADRRPFTVRTELGDAFVVGTRFEIMADEDDLRLIVVEGEVSLNSGAHTAHLGAGEISEVAKGTEPTVRRVDDVFELIDWIDDFIAFEATPLRTIASELERRYGVQVEIGDADLAERTVSAWFTDQSLDEIVAILCRITDASCSFQNSSIYIE